MSDNESDWVAVGQGDWMTSKHRAWVMPGVFALVALSLPVQMLILDRVSEPYPALFEPRFANVLDHDDDVRFRRVELSVDGTPISSELLFPVPSSEVRRALLASMFPPHGDHPRLDDPTRQFLRRTIAEAMHIEPHELVVVWERRRFDLDTQVVTTVRKLSTFHVDLQGRAP